MCAKTTSCTMYYLSRFKKLGYVFLGLISRNSSNRCGGINHTRFVARNWCYLIHEEFHYTLNFNIIMLSPSKRLTSWSITATEVELVYFLLCHLNAQGMTSLKCDDIFCLIRMDSSHKKKTENIVVSACQIEVH